MRPKAGLLGMTLIEQDHELRRGQRRQEYAFRDRPPKQLAGGETPQTQPKPMAIIDQQFESRRGTIAEDVQGAGKRVLLPPVTAEGDEGVNTLAKIDRFDRQQNPQLRYQLEHRLRTQERDTERFGLAPL